MTIIEFQELRYATPFRPFAIKFKNGTQIDVTNRENVAINPFTGMGFIFTRDDVCRFFVEHVAWQLLPEQLK